ncbi:hypothetical protein QOT17_024652 [Balamuthia mandrillaris]
MSNHTRVLQLKLLVAFFCLFANAQQEDNETYFGILQDELGMYTEWCQAFFQADQFAADVHLCVKGQVLASIEPLQIRFLGLEELAPAPDDKRQFDDGFTDFDGFDGMDDILPDLDSLCDVLCEFFIEQSILFAEAAYQMFSEFYNTGNENRLGFRQRANVEGGNWKVEYIIFNEPEDIVEAGELISLSPGAFKFGFHLERWNFTNTDNIVKVMVQLSFAPALQLVFEEENNFLRKINITEPTTNHTWIFSMNEHCVRDGEIENVLGVRITPLDESPNAFRLDFYFFAFQHSLSYDPSLSVLLHQQGEEDGDEGDGYSDGEDTGNKNGDGDDSSPDSAQLFLYVGLPIILMALALLVGLAVALHLYRKKRTKRWKQKVALVTASTLQA